MKSKVHAEVCISNENKLPLNTITTNLKPQLLDYLKTHKQDIKFNEDIILRDIENLKDAVKWFTVECERPSDFLNFAEVDLNEIVFHFYRPHGRAAEVELFDEQEGESGGGADGEVAVQASNHWLLPATQFVGLWESLIFDEDIKEKLLRYALSALLLGQYNVNSNIIACNRLILLHGPPGTGKTSLCKALAQKLAVRQLKTFRNTHLIEINSHSLFSKWFSESGKLVMRLFNKIRELIADPKNLVCVLIDEVESLAYARDSMCSQEPKDAMRVVNALLTQLDSIREHPNVLVLATSNLAKTIDLAFLDRADIKLCIGLPGPKAMFGIHRSVINELIRVGILETLSDEDVDFYANQLCKIYVRNISGRAIRKLPFQAFANLGLADMENGKIERSVFFEAMMDTAIMNNI